MFDYAKDPEWDMDKINALPKWNVEKHLENLSMEGLKVYEAEVETDLPSWTHAQREEHEAMMMRLKERLQ